MTAKETIKKNDVAVVLGFGHYVKIVNLAGESVRCGKEYANELCKRYHGQRLIEKYGMKSGRDYDLSKRKQGTWN